MLPDATVLLTPVVLFALPLLPSACERNLVYMDRISSALGEAASHPFSHTPSHPD